MKLDRTQTAYAATRTDHVVRFVVTVVDKKGERQLFDPQQGRYTFETPDGALARLRALTCNKQSIQRINEIHGPQAVSSLAVRPVACYEGHHDPMGVYFDDDGEVS